MGDKNFTFIELHFDTETLFGSGSLGEVLPIGGTDSTAETEETEPDEAAAVSEDSGGKGKSAVGALIALAVLVGIAVAARKFRGGDEETELETEDEPDVIVN